MGGGGGLYEHDITLCRAEAAGAGGAGAAELEAALARAGPALEALRRARGAGALAFMAQPARRGGADALAPLAAERRGAADDVVVLGAGGASLGGRALCALAQDRAPVAGARMHFPDNADARSFAALLGGLDFARAQFLVVSKSGATAETLAQFALAWQAARAALGEAAARAHFIVVCAPGANPLRRLAARLGLAVVDHPPDLGGRYSVLSPVGLLPALFAGLDAAAACAGAAAALDRALGASRPADSPPALGAAVHVALAETRGARLAVTMPYADRLAAFARWHAQLWAESLGKGGKGTAPAAALGPRDQHSQLQLWLDGPPGVFVTIVSCGAAGDAPRAAPGFAAGDPELAWLAGASLDDLACAMAAATAEALAAAGRPARRIRIAALDEYRLGALFMHFMLETVIAAHMWGVDPFDQPAVEAGKRRARARLAALARRRAGAGP